MAFNYDLAGQNSSSQGEQFRQAPVQRPPEDAVPGKVFVKNLADDVVESKLARSLATRLTYRQATLCSTSPSLGRWQRRRCSIMMHPEACQENLGLFVCRCFLLSEYSSLVCRCCGLVQFVNADDALTVIAIKHHMLAGKEVSEVVNCPYRIVGANVVILMSVSILVCI